MSRSHFKGKKLTKLDLELLGEIKTRDINAVIHDVASEDKGQKLNNGPPPMSFDPIKGLYGQCVMPAPTVILPNAILPKKRKASKELVSGKIAFPAKRRSPAPTSYQVKKATQAKVEPLPMKQFKFDGKSSGQADKGALPEGSTKARHRVKQEPFASPHLMAPTTSGCHGLFDGTNDDDGVSGPIKDQPLDSINLTHHRQRSDISNEGIGGTESEIERGATNLWSILQKADAANTDEEDRGDAETKLSVKCSLMSPKSAQTSISPQKKARRDFLSTVLNDSPGKTAKASTVDPLPEPTNKGPSLIDSSGNPDQLADSPHTPANYDSQNRQAHLKADTDAIGVETAATLPKPRKPISTHTNPTLSSKPKSTNTTTNDPRTPSRICKTTGKPFDRTITVRATPRKRAPPIAEYVSDQIAIPTSWAQVSDADQRMMQMKEEGRGWEAIRRMWRETTGQDAAPSTLPNRYNRIKANLTVLQDGEHALLLQAVTEVEKMQKAEKWARVAALMQSRGAGKYPAEYLQKQFSALH